MSITIFINPLFLPIFIYSRLLSLNLTLLKFKGLKLDLKFNGFDLDLLLEFNGMKLDLTFGLEL